MPWTTLTRELLSSCWSVPDVLATENQWSSSTQAPLPMHKWHLQLACLASLPQLWLACAVRCCAQSLYLLGISLLIYHSCGSPGLSGAVHTVHFCQPSVRSLTTATLPAVTRHCCGRLLTCSRTLQDRSRLPLIPRHCAQTAAAAPG